MAFSRITTVILAISITALAMAAAAFALTLNDRNAGEIVTSPNNDNTSEDIDPEPAQQQWQQPPDGKSLTGNLTVYMLPVDLKKHESTNVIDIVRKTIGDVHAAFYTNLGASPQGQYGDETIEVTQDNDPEGFKKGDVITRTVIKKPAETLKFYIDTAIVNPINGSGITRADLREDYSFGNGISCCGFTLADGTDIGNAVIIVVDWVYDEYMMEKLDELGTALK